MNRPGVGVGVIIANKRGEILVKKRQGSHAQKYSIPGGHVELGETFEQAAKKEIKEETNLEIKTLRVIAVTNNLETYREEGFHYVSIILVADKFTGKLINLEPEKCAELIWVNPKKLPQPHFDGSRLGVECYLKSKFYIGIK